MERRESGGERTGVSGDGRMDRKDWIAGRRAAGGVQCTETECDEWRFTDARARVQEGSTGEHRRAHHMTHLHHLADVLHLLLCELQHLPLVPARVGGEGGEEGE